MVQKIGPEELNVILKFGGGLHTRASPDEIDGREAAGGQNFIIDIQNRNLRNRPPFDLLGTAPNAQSINGGGSFIDASGNVHAFIQAGSTVYSWDGASTFTSIGTVAAASKLRGHWRSHTWNLGNGKLLITDLSLVSTVQEWDGTTTGFMASSFTDENDNPFGSFYAKYLQIQNERAIFANVFAGIATPQMIVGSEIADYNTITINNTPSIGIGTSAPFFLLSPDLRPINAFLDSYLGAMISTEHGEIFNLTGTDSTNFAFATFYSASAATGNESLSEIGNDFIYGRQGRIESVVSTNAFGNSEADDITNLVADQISTYNGWTIVFNGRTRKAYCFPTGVSEVWVMDPAILDVGLSGGNSVSPWMRWRTTHSLQFRPTFVMSMLSPKDGLEYIIMGDASGNVYVMEGTGTAGDGGSASIDTQFLSKLISCRLDSKGYDIEGYVKYIPQPATTATLTLTFQNQGDNVFTTPITTVLAKASGGFYWSGFHWSDGSHWNAVTNRFTRNRFWAPGNINEFQILVDVNSTGNIIINEIGLRLRAATQ